MAQIITADQARARAQRTLTLDDLRERYEIGTQLIQQRADLGYYSLAVTVASELALEYKTFIESQGFQAFFIDHGDDSAKSVAPQIRTESVTEMVIIWQTFLFFDTMPTGVNPLEPGYQQLFKTQQQPRTLYVKNSQQRFATIDITVTSGFEPGQELYYRFQGTLTADDYSDGQTEGTVILDDQGEAAVIIQLKTTGPSRQNKTNITEISWDDQFQGVIYTAGTITIDESEIL